MKLAAIAIFAALAATPALAQANYPDSNPTTVAPGTNVDGRVAMKDSAQQNYYKHKLDAANAQAQVDNAQAQADQATANRDAALDAAADDRDQAHAAAQQ